MKPADVINRMLPRFADVEDTSYEGVFFKTSVPWVAPKAYLHILFPPAPPELIAARKAQLGIPDPIADFYRSFNGVLLFSGTLAIFGLLPDSYLLNRDDWRCRKPFNLDTETRRWRKRFQSQKLFCFGSYSYDGSPICLSQETSSVTVFEAGNLDLVRSSWHSFDSFFEAEVERLCAFFDEEGRCKVSSNELLPSLHAN